MTTYCRPINCLRGVAALIVVTYHFHLYSDFPWHERFPVTRFGFIGVDFFFVLSGLIIAHVYLKQFEPFQPAIYWDFLSRRIARIFPVHALVMLLMLVLPFLYYGSVQDGPIASYGIKSWVQQLFMVEHWFLPKRLTWNFPAWTISAEMFAYIFLFPIVALHLRGRRKRAYAFVLFAVGLLGVAVIVEDWGTLNRVQSGMGLMRVALEFSAGVGLYGLLAWTKVTRAYWNGLAVAGIVLFAVLALANGAALFVKAPYFFEYCLFIAIIIIIAGVYKSSGWLADLLSSAPLFYLGEISYCIYIVHVPLFRAAREITDLIFGPGHAGVLFCLVGTLLVVAVSALLHKTVELPARRALRHKFDNLGRSLLPQAHKKKNACS